MNLGRKTGLYEELALPYVQYALVIVGLVLLFSTILAFSHFDDVGGRYGSDDEVYHKLALNLLRDHRFDSTYRAPGYPVLIALIYAVVGPCPFIVFLIQAFLFSASLWIILKILMRVTHDIDASLLGLLMCAVFPPFYMRTIAALLTETLAIFLVCVFVWFFQERMERPSLRNTILVAITLVILIYTKPIMLPFVLIASLCFVWTAKDRRLGIVHAIVFLIAVATSMAPWIYRNYRITGHIVPVTTGGGVNLWIGNWPGEYGAQRYAADVDREWPHLPPDLQRSVAGMTEIERDRYLTRVVLSYWKEDPVRAAGVFLDKFSALWLGKVGANIGCWRPPDKPFVSIGQFAIPVAAVVFVPLLIGAIYGYVLVMSDLGVKGLLPVTLLISWWTIAYMLTVADRRYGLPVYPYAIGFAAVGIKRAWRQTRWFIKKLRSGSKRCTFALFP